MPTSATLSKPFKSFAITAGVAIGLALASTGAWAQSKASKSFLKEAIQGNYAEVQMGELAQKNGQSDAIKSYGQMLVTDHGDANKKAIAVANDAKMTPPTGASRKQKADHEKMAKMTGTAFDKAFAKDMVKDHKKDIAAYRKEAKSKDAAGQYAAQTLPTLQKHLEAAQKLARGDSASR
jgi:putative membrane protein